MINARSTLIELIEYIKDLLSSADANKPARYQIAVVDTNGERTKSGIIDLGIRFQVFLPKLVQLAENHPDEARQGIWQNEFLELETILDKHFTILDKINQIDNFINLKFFKENSNVLCLFKAAQIVRVEIEYF